MFDLLILLVVEGGKAVAKLAAVGLLGLLVYQVYTKRRYSGWVVRLVDGDTLKSELVLGALTAKEFLQDTWKRKLGLKSCCADVGVFLNVDVLTISDIDVEGRVYIVHLDRNPSKPAPKPKPSDSELVIGWLKENAPRLIEEAFIRALERDSEAQKKKAA